MPRDTTLNDIIPFIHEYYKNNNTIPNLADWKLKNGFPCNKEKLLHLCGKYNDLIKSLGYETYSYGERHYNKKQLLKDLLDAVKQHRSVDFRYIRKNNNLKHRDIYTAQFGSVRKALKLAGISNNEILLMKDFEDYDFSDPITFLNEKLFENKIAVCQRNLIKDGIKLFNTGINITRDDVCDFISSRQIYSNFKKFPYFVIMCGFECRLTGKQQYKADDGHLCDSYEECIVDNCLYYHNIKHDVHVKYPNSRMICDFKIKDIFVEYTGFKKVGGKLSEIYTERLEIKRKLAKNNGIRLLEIDNIKDATLDRLCRGIEV